MTKPDINTWVNKVAQHVTDVLDWRLKSPIKCPCLTSFGSLLSNLGDLQRNHDSLSKEIMGETVCALESNLSWFTKAYCEGDDYMLDYMETFDDIREWFYGL